MTFRNYRRKDCLQNRPQNALLWVEIDDGTPYKPLIISSKPKIVKKFAPMCCTKRNLPYICNRNRENSSVGRARPCQGRGRGFESRFSLFFFVLIYGCPDGGIGRRAGLKILCPVMDVPVRSRLRVRCSILCKWLFYKGFFVFITLIERYFNIEESLPHTPVHGKCFSRKRNKKPPPVSNFSAAVATR